MEYYKPVYIFIKIYKSLYNLIAASITFLSSLVVSPEISLVKDSYDSLLTSNPNFINSSKVVLLILFNRSLLTRYRFSS